MNSVIRTMVVAVFLAATQLSMAQTTLSSDVSFVSLAPGGVQNLQIETSPALAGMVYGLFGSASGTAPGFAHQGFQIALNQDDYFVFSLTDPAADFLFVNRVGVIDPNGGATAAFVLPSNTSPFFNGVVLHHVFGVVDPAQNVQAVSNPVSVELTQDLFKVTAPINGSTVGSRVVDIRGTLGSALANASNLSVTVNGQAATLALGEQGETAFVLQNQTLGFGGNTITVTAAADGGLLQTQTVQVNVVSRPSNNIDTNDSYAFIARGADGFSTINLETREVFDFASPAGTGSVDDLSVAGDFLFVLDASFPGNLSVLNISDPTSPSLVSGPVSVPVSPFAGVSAAGGRVVVSGGTSNMTIRSYNTTTGGLSTAFATANLGIGQPDVVLSANGASAYASVDFAGTVNGAGFGMTILNLQNPPAAPTTVGSVGLLGAGFTGGLQGPANFPVESAAFPLVNIRALTAHGGGLSLIRTNNATLVSTQPLPFSATSVDIVGRTAFVVGGNQMRIFDYTTFAAPQVVSTSTIFSGAGSLTSVSATDRFIGFSANQAGTIIRSR